MAEQVSREQVVARLETPMIGSWWKSTASPEVVVTSIVVKYQDPEEPEGVTRVMPVGEFLLLFEPHGGA